MPDINSSKISPPPAAVLTGRCKINYEQELNPQQLAVVMAGTGPMLVIAGPGSGKTRTVTYRVARLIESGVNPETILLLTFTNKAARTMLDRVSSLVPFRTLHFWGGTFHHIGNVLLRKHAKLIGYQNNYTIIDRDDSKDLIDEVLKSIKLDASAGAPTGKPPKNFPKSNLLLDIFSYSANTGRDIKEVIAEYSPQFTGFSSDIIRISGIYAAKKSKQNLMDFDDLLFNWKKLFEEHKDIRDFYARKFIYTLVDEYQDTNHLQGEIIDLIAGVHRNLTVVGDDAQSIYSFRGADFANIMEFPNRYPDAKVYKLETNYRSTPEILRLANCCIKHNARQFSKNLKALCPRGDFPRLVILDNNFAQADFVAREILELHQREKIPLNQMAVLYRAHYQSMELQMELTNLRIPFEIRSGLRFFEQAHIKDVLSYLKIIANMKNELAWQRLLRLYPGIGPTSANYLSNAVRELNNLRSLSKLPHPPRFSAEAGKSWSELVKLINKLDAPTVKNIPSALINIILDEWYRDYLEGNYPDARDRLDDLKQLGVFAGQFDSLDEFLSRITLLTTVESEEHRPNNKPNDFLILSSIHQAKGLEWRVVFVIGLVEGRFPDSRHITESDLEEERRLFYVAVTRTKEKLYLCYPQAAEKRHALYEIIQQPSRFLQELDASSYREVRISRNDFY